MNEYSVAERKTTESVSHDAAGTTGQRAEAAFDDLRPAAQEQSRLQEAIGRKNDTGLPDALKAGVERLSGYSMDDVNVHLNSSSPDRYQALAYAEGSDIYLKPGQEKHLPHEAWHVVQQMQGRVPPTKQMKREVSVNDDTRLEREADVMGKRALQVAGEKNARPDPAFAAGFADQTNTGFQCNKRDSVIQLQKLPTDRGKIIGTPQGLPELDELIKEYNATKDENKNDRYLVIEKIKNNEYYKNTKSYNGPWIRKLRKSVELESIDISNPIINNINHTGKLNGHHPVKTYSYDGEEQPTKIGTYNEIVSNLFGEEYYDKSDIIILNKGENRSLVQMTNSQPYQGVSWNQANRYWVDNIDITFNKEKKDEPLTNSTHRPATGRELFPNTTPSTNEVKQGNLGNCWLLAALITITNRNPNEIRNIIKKEDEDDLYTVTMHDINGDGENKTYNKRTITIDNKIATDDQGKEIFSEEYLWVQLIEKAYTMFGFSGSESNTKNGAPASYADLKGGKVKYAIEHLIGKNASIKEFANTDDKKFNEGPFYNTKYDYLGELNKMIEILKNHGMKPGEAITTADKWLSSRENIMKEVQKISNHENGEYRGTKRLEDMEKVNFGETEKFKQIITEGDFLPGKRGTGKYDKQQNELFSTIVESVTKNKLAAISSKEQVGRNNKNKTKEQIRKGIIRNHAYAVLDFGYGENKDKKPNNEPGELKWVKIQNPWGQTVREYERSEEKLRAKEATGKNGAFWIELSDISKQFINIHLEQF